MEAVIYLLDTDTLIFMVRGLKPGRRPSQRQRALNLVDRCRQAQAAGDIVGLSAVTVSELEFGAQNSTDYEAEIAAVHKVLVPFDLFDYSAVSCPPHYGRIRHHLDSKGQTIGSMDLLIAAHALALDATLVTNNLAHFSRVPGLKTVNWNLPPA
jgi:tRNA(fMet)-specific endonuclease VapC